MRWAYSTMALSTTRCNETWQKCLSSLFNCNTG